jgi:membrane protein DedA with SNARE-associated domain
MVCIARRFRAACLADSLSYTIGKSQHNSLTSKLTSKQLSAKATPIAKFFAQGMLGGLLAVKFSLFPSSIVALFAGSARFSLGRFLLFQAIANLLWCSIFLLGGFLSADRSVKGLGKFIRPSANPLSGRLNDSPCRTKQLTATD